MKLLRFESDGIHGFLSQNIQFNASLTFLTGINGSGKSSVIHSIIALISPSPVILANLQFKSMRLTLEHEDEVYTLGAKRAEGAITLHAKHLKETFTFAPYPFDPDEMRYLEKEAEYYKTVLSGSANNPVVAFISSLPTPMFLDIDRRASASVDVPSYRVYRRRRERNIFSASLANSIWRATAFAESEKRALDAGLNRISIQYRQRLILELLAYKPNMHMGGPIQKPTKHDLRIISDLRMVAPSIPKLLQVNQDQISENLNPFLDAMQNWASMIPEEKNLDEILAQTSESDRLEASSPLRAIVSWSANVAQLKKIAHLIEIVKEHTEAVAKASAPLVRYLDSINKFFIDSNKKLEFDEAGNLGFVLTVGGPLRSLTALSSGEAQIFVLLTHLFYDPLAQHANVFIIDEPELSLHVAWQELFVESVTAANPTVQYIMATHSPSIILDRIDECKDLGQSAVFDSRGG